ncbi:hypothetical protein J23TS9_19710 [Paenibacillus sp. J23TS9]|uniref:DUF3298 domain-containing protein n=1 Tax=Paenibacillus sp. J23TS9 TaxID=2807193 RepID=UPI001AFFEE49|nr:DUF3298 domain-containing protein [Paenibacillus sp. J23TS9]GIP26841.1 hypothetical protein J23TS9_19710 [Paenibacillus sp. J23TS9]
MKKKTVNLIKMSAVGCAAMMGVSAASLPVNAMASIQAPAVVAASVQASAPTAAAVKVIEKVLTTTSTNLITHIQVPQLTGMMDTHYQAELNDIILSHAEKDLAAWEKEAGEAALKAKAEHLEFHPYDLYITYNLKSDGTGNPAGVVSLEVITEGSRGGTSMPRIDTYNVENKVTAERVTLSGILGENYKEKLDADILAQIKKDPDKYFIEDYKGTSVEQTFYLEKGELIIVFPKYSIAPGYVGSPEFHFGLKDHSTAVTRPAETKLEAAVKLDLKKVANYKNKHGVTMVSLRDVAHQLGYELKWNPNAKSAEVKKEAQWTSVSIGEGFVFLYENDSESFGGCTIPSR